MGESEAKFIFCPKFLVVCPSYSEIRTVSKWHTGQDLVPTLIFNGTSKTEHSSLKNRSGQFSKHQFMDVLKSPHLPEVLLRISCEHRTEQEIYIFI